MFWTTVITLVSKNGNPSSPHHLLWADIKLFIGQIKPKSRLAHCRFSQKMNKWIWFFCREEERSKKTKFVCSFFGRIYGVPICLRLYLTFSRLLVFECKNWSQNPEWYLAFKNDAQGLRVLGHFHAAWGIHVKVRNSWIRYIVRHLASKSDVAWSLQIFVQNL